MSLSVQKISARKLRRTGKSIKNIASTLKVSVGSVSKWVRDIELTEDQKKILDNNARNPYYGKRGEYIASLIKNTNLKIESLKQEGIKKVGTLNTHDFFIAGAALYWAEGFKKDTQVGFANLDPEMIKFFIKWLKVCFGYGNSDFVFRVTVNISHKHRIKEIQQYWSNTLKMPLAQFQKPFYQDVKWKKVYENPNNYYGIVRVKVRKSKDFLRKIHGFIEGLRLNSQMG